MAGKVCSTCNGEGKVSGLEVKNWIETYNVSSHYRFRVFADIKDEEKYVCPTCEGFKNTL
jgi:hypothetical protein